MSEDVIVMLIWMGFIFGGIHAWWAKRRKIACALWLLAIWMAVGAYMTTTHGAKSIGQKNACISNLKQIDGAVQQWALEHEKKATNTYTFSDPVLLANLRGSALPTCPGGGHYSPGTTVSDSPKCSLAAQGHTL